VRDRSALTGFADLLQARAAEQPSQTAFTWLGNTVDQDVSISYAELDFRARAVAAVLQREGPAGERALLVFLPGLDFLGALFGCFYAGWIAVPAYPPPPRTQPADRIRSVARDAQPLVALTSAALLQPLRTRLSDDPDLGQLHWRAIDGDPRPEPNPWRPAAVPSHPDPNPWRPSATTYPKRNAVSPSGPVMSASDVAVLQYTSGSTAAPRGVMLTHANLLHNAAQIERRFDVQRTPASQGVIWLPPYHDMGLIGGILEGVYAGFPIALMAPVAFLQRPRRWLEAITRTRATISGGPNFAYDLCVDRIPPADRAGLDLSSWTVAFNGSEPVRASTLRRFSEAFGPCGFHEAAFYPCYGLAEATLMVAGGRAAEPPVVMKLEDDRRIVGCGRAIDDQRLLIVDPTTRSPSANGLPGEVWVTGPSVAAGYWRQPDLTQTVFQALPSPPTDTAYLRTGDLGFLDAEGELFITGRIKAVLIVGGRKIQAEDIEATLASGRPDIRPGGVVALSTDSGGQEQLVVVCETPKQLPVTELPGLVRSIRTQIAEAHQLPVSAVLLTRPGGIPRTSSGKVRRSACREAVLDGSLATLYEWRLQPYDPGAQR
jgi:acyl-CoA synthetase (AMP-forming)/AMP-acid ligase II